MAFVVSLIVKAYLRVADWLDPLLLASGSTALKALLAVTILLVVPFSLGLLTRLLDRPFRRTRGARAF